MKNTLTCITGDENTQPLTPQLSALVEFYHAFNHRDIDAMCANWAHTDDIAMSNPLGGIKRGWTEIQSVYERIFTGRTRVYVEYYDFVCHHGDDMFCVIGRERGNFQAGETRVELAIRTSRIFQMLDGHWRQIHHHGSIDDPELLARYQHAVRAE